MKQLLHDLDGQNNEKRILEIVSERLSSFGKVDSLKVLDLPTQDSRILLITMDSRQATAAAIDNLGMVSFGERSLLFTLPNRHG